LAPAAQGGQSVVQVGFSGTTLVNVLAAPSAGNVYVLREWVCSETGTKIATLQSGGDYLASCDTNQNTVQLGALVVGAAVTMNSSTTDVSVAALRYDLEPASDATLGVGSVSPNDVCRTQDLGELDYLVVVAGCVVIFGVFFILGRGLWS
jgi:hypothetical protein